MKTLTGILLTLACLAVAGCLDTSGLSRPYQHRRQYRDRELRRQIDDLQWELDTLRWEQSFTRPPMY